MSDREDGLRIFFASGRLRNYLEVVLQAVDHFGKVLLSASDELRENRDLSRGGAAQRPGH